MIKNFELTSINAERYSGSNERIKNVRVDHNSTVTQVNQLNEEDAAVKFRFTVNYSGIGMVKIEGQFVFSGDASSLTAQWKENGQMPGDIANQIHNSVLGFCIPEAVLLARDLKLPPPVPIPKVNVAQKQGTAKPTYGPEVA
jgi:hypothetical protein